MRIVSLVPSLTELLYDLGLQNEIVGRTKFCIHPSQKVNHVTKVGGTKKVKHEVITALNPDLIIANKEENTKDDILMLEKTFKVYVSDISNLEEAMEAIIAIGALTNRNEQAQQLTSSIERAFSQFNATHTHQGKVCYLVWREPYMTIGSDTFINDMLTHCGFMNVFGEQARYPVVSLEDIESKQPDYIFLSSEPFPFKEKHVQYFAQAFPKAKTLIVDGEFFSWYGSRMLPAVDYFRHLIQSLA